MNTLAVYQDVDWYLTCWIMHLCILGSDPSKNVPTVLDQNYAVIA